jgi:hypothetical protein
VSLQNLHHRFRFGWNAFEQSVKLLDLLLADILVRQNALQFALTSRSRNASECKVLELTRRINLHKIFGPVDTSFTTHYAVSMGTEAAILRTQHVPYVLAILLLLVFAAPRAVIAAPVIMLLEHIEDGQRITTEIKASPELKESPHAGKGQLKFAILPGDALKAKLRPNDRMVHLFRKVGLQHVALCVIRVRYFRNRDSKWLPHFQLNQEPLFVRKNKRWVPLTTVKGIATMIVLTSSTLPNAQGYYPSLEFGLTTGLTFIDSWVVR